MPELMGQAEPTETTTTAKRKTYGLITTHSGESGVKLYPNCNLEDNYNANGRDIDVPKTRQISVADLIGEYGFYQLSLTIFTLFRYTLMATMTNAGPLLAPELNFYCKLDSEISSQLDIPKNTAQSAYLMKKCQVKLINGTNYTCNKWTFETNSTGPTLTDEFNLVCDRDWLRSAFQSCVSIGVVFAAVIWGSISDRHGRSKTLWICFIWTLGASAVSYYAQDLTTFAIARSLSTFGDLGSIATLSTLIVETLGNKWRGTVGLIVYTGWSLGVMCMPWLLGYFLNFRHSMLFLIVCHLLNLPWLLMTGESIRWLLVNGYPERARKEIKRVNWWNCRRNREFLREVDRKFDVMKQKFVKVGESEQHYRMFVLAKMSWCKYILVSLFGGLGKVGDIFKSPVLAMTAITIIWTTFNSELFYMLSVLVNSDIGDNIKLNYLIGGLMESLATIISILMVAAMTRKFSLAATLVSVSISCLSLAFTHQMPTASTWVLQVTKLAVSTLSSLVYVITTESYPTNLRQTGFGLSGTIGSLGAVVAPFIRTELMDAIGMTRVLLILMFMPLTAALLVMFYLKETKGVDLSDEVDELETEASIGLAASARRGSRLSWRSHADEPRNGERK